jgi:hypothetical protein
VTGDWNCYTAGTALDCHMTDCTGVTYFTDKGEKRVVYDCKTVTCGSCPEGPPSWCTKLIVSPSRRRDACGS